jgi:hypothetical protein
VIGTGDPQGARCFAEGGACGDDVVDEDASASADGLGPPFAHGESTGEVLRAL